jgi:hypothetical protein
MTTSSLGLALKIEGAGAKEYGLPLEAARTRKYVLPSGLSLLFFSSKLGMEPREPS